MKVLLLENSRKKRIQLHEELEEKKLKVVSCSTSNEFLTVISENKFDKVIMNEEFWGKGSSIYCYFDANKKLEDTPLLTYNADESFSNICDRAKHENDQILHKPVDNNLIIEAAMQN